MNEITVPIYLITGFLESGKTSLICTLTVGLFLYRRNKNPFILLEEEGEVEYDKAVREMSNTVVEIIEKGRGSSQYTALLLWIS